MNIKDVKAIARILVDMNPNDQERFIRLDDRIADELEDLVAHELNRTSEHDRKKDEWIRLSRKNGAVVFFGDTLVFQGERAEADEMKEQTQKEFEEIFGVRWKGGMNVR